MNELRTHLQDLVDTAVWEWLEEHAQEGRMLIVAPHLELVDVGLALAEDDISIVKQWLDDGWLYRPTDGQISHWQNDKNLEFKSLIIQPFVLCRLPADG
ncbi:uncharacterized conserved small protein [Synechococcus sp. PCC 7502]|uniref:DUF2288 domain-containing protein n=1 Tax=Synechococcus sp. PCC 7502 TaxID=1173263 RepID=UPI00029FC22A|nr:DUF2288 domain-containing protein [Synechococcus sp. PCC 7502]AFY75301.1 uncharacterized conserved small protein [Synechococcus sp. PCC 7502]